MMPHMCLAAAVSHFLTLIRAGNARWRVGMTVTGAHGSLILKLGPGVSLQKDASCPELLLLLSLLQLGRVSKSDWLRG